MIKPICFLTVLLISPLCLIGCAEQNAAPQSQLNLGAPAVDPFDPDRPPTVKTLYVMADILVSQGRDPAAELMLKRIVRESPDFFPAYTTLAELQMRNRRIAEATSTLSAGLQINPNDSVLLNNLGMCWLIRKDYEKALEFFTQAAGIVPENTRYRSNMATALVLLDRREEALALYEQILPKEEAAENINILCDSVK